MFPSNLSICLIFCVHCFCAVCCCEGENGANTTMSLAQAGELCMCVYAYVGVCVYVCGCFVSSCVVSCACVGSGVCAVCICMHIYVSLV